jgi:hypothetical protein
VLAGRIRPFGAGRGRGSTPTFSAQRSSYGTVVMVVICLQEQRNRKRRGGQPLMADLSRRVRRRSGLSAVPSLFRFDDLDGRDAGGCRFLKKVNPDIARIASYGTRRERRAPARHSLNPGPGPVFGPPCIEYTLVPSISGPEIERFLAICRFKPSCSHHTHAISGLRGHFYFAQTEHSRVALTTHGYFGMTRSLRCTPEVCRIIAPGRGRRPTTRGFGDEEFFPCTLKGVPETIDSVFQGSCPTEHLKADP